MASFSIQGGHGLLAYWGRVASRAPEKIQKPNSGKGKSDTAGPADASRSGASEACGSADPGRVASAHPDA